MKRTQKKFERDPRKKNFASEILGYVKAKNCEQSSQFKNMGTNSFK